MAKATVVRAVAPIVSVTLELSEDEARFLRTLLGRNIAGGGLRHKLSDPIYTALDDAGIALFPPHQWLITGYVEFS